MKVVRVLGSEGVYLLENGDKIPFGELRNLTVAPKEVAVEVEKPKKKRKKRKKKGE